MKTLAVTKRNCRFSTEDDDKLLRSMDAPERALP
jgi:hypothetical protein